MADIIDQLEQVLDERKDVESDNSYVASLYSKGNGHICDKILEEASELVEASEDTTQQVVHETADLLFHVLVLLASRDIKYARIKEELERRFGTSGIDEKNNRNN